jgi:DNA-binding transcriptional regulator PaaX
MAKWLMLLYRMPREPTAPRMAIWRALQRIEGGGYLQDGVFVVKNSKLNEITLQDLAHDIRNAMGEATIATGGVDDEAHLAERLAAAKEPQGLAARSRARKKQRG